MAPSHEPISTPDAALVERVAGGLGFEDPWRGIEAVAREIVVPAFDRHGPAALSVLAEQRKNSPWAAAVLVELAGCRELSPLAFFTPDELIEGALAYLVDSTFDHQWAWMAVRFGEFDIEDYWRLVMELIERAPNWDDVLWRLGDGPLAELQMRPGASKRIAELAISNPKLARILTLVRELP